MYSACNYAQHMSRMIQVRNVPDSLHRTLKAQAALSRTSLSDFLLAEIRHVAERPTNCGAAGTLAPPLPGWRPRIRGRSHTPGAGCTAIVLDASAAIERLFQSPAGIKIDGRIFSPSETLHVPHLLDVEVAQVLGRYVRDKTITAQRGGRSAGRPQPHAAQALSARFLDSARWKTSGYARCL